MNDKLPKIYMIDSNEIEVESEESSFQKEWCPKSETKQQAWINAVQVELESIAALDPRPVGQSRNEFERKFYSQIGKKWVNLHEEFKPTIDPVRPEVPETLSAIEALNWPESHLGVDFRPHLFDKDLNAHILVDSGSQVCAFPPNPGDKVIKGVFLKAANGSKIKCFGTKHVTIKIGRKSYPCKAYIAEVASPIIGWDFMKHHKLDLIWNEEGEQCIHDKKASITKVLDFKSVDHHTSSSLKNLSVVESFSRLRTPRESQELAFQIATLESLGVEEEDLEEVPDSEFKEILAKYPDILKQNFSEDFTKSGITHRINIKEDAKQCRAKLRRLLPGSPKAKKAKEAWDEYVRLGIVEKVDPSRATTWSSPLHFV